MPDILIIETISGWGDRWDVGSVVHAAPVVADVLVKEGLATLDIGLVARIVAHEGENAG